MSQSDGHYVETEIAEARCPECDNESGNVQYERKGDIQPMPSEMSGECGECGHRDHPITFHHTYQWDRMTDDERETARQAREHAEAAYLSWHYSVSGIAARRER